MGGVVDDITDFGEDLIEGAGDLIQGGADALEDAVDDVGDELDRVGERVEGYVKDIPKVIVKDVLDDTLGIVQVPTVPDAPTPFGRDGDAGPGYNVLPSPFRRPRPTPLTPQQALDDRRRSIASAVRRRRRASSSILGGAPETPLGGA